MGRGKRSATLTAPPELAAGRPDLTRSSQPDLLLGHDDPTPGMETTTAAEAYERLRRLGPAQIRARLAGGLIIDLDDTLNVNHALFLRSRAHLTEIFWELAPARDPYELALAHRDSSNALIPVYGYTPQRWYAGALEAAERCAGRALSVEERERVLSAAEIGVGIGELYPYVAETLALLKEAGVPRVLLTKGEPAKQREKIAGHRLEEYFSDVVITDHKDAALLRAVAQQHGLTDPVVIGDSERSDILPATEAGYDSVLIDRGAPKWIMERHDDEVDSARATGLPEALAMLVGAEPTPR